MISCEPLLEQLRGLCLDLVTYNNDKATNRREYIDLRSQIGDGGCPLPNVVVNNRTAAQLREASQRLGGYAERRAWVNGAFDGILDAMDAAKPPTHVLSAGPLLSHTSRRPFVFTSIRPAFPPGLHPEIVKRCKVSYEANDFDTALSNAFKRVEVRIRELGGFAPTDLGVSLVSLAMGQRGTPPPPAVISFSDILAEQEGYHQLFRGAIAAFKNPLSHREVGHSDRNRTSELLNFASHLLYLLDSATINRPTTPVTPP